MYMIFASVAPLFFIILAGVIVERMQFLPAATTRALSVFSLNISIPCLIFHIMCAAPLEYLAEWRWWLGSLTVQVGFLGLFYFIERRLGRESGPAMVYSLSVAFCNAGFVGLPVIINVYQSDPMALTVAGLMMVSANAVCIIAQMVILAYARKRQGREDEAACAGAAARCARFVRRYILSNGIFMATFLGLIVCLTGIRVWEPLDRAVTMIGYISPACMLFTLGLSLRHNLVQSLRSGGIAPGHQVWLCFWRVAGMPMVLLAVLVLLDLDPLWICVSTIIMSTGSAIFSAALAELYQCVPGPVSLTVAVTNVLSLLSLMGALTLLTWMGWMPPGFSLQ